MTESSISATGEPIANICEMIKPMRNGDKKKGIIVRQRIATTTKKKTYQLLKTF